MTGEAMGPVASCSASWLGAEQVVRCLGLVKAHVGQNRIQCVRTDTRHHVVQKINGRT